MKGGREVGKVMGPLFPRLHVNDADKGGPRAPPRNKMALYEQFRIPTRRFNRGLFPPSSLQFPSSSSSSYSVPSASNSQEKMVIFQHNLAPQPPASLSKESQCSISKAKDPYISRLDSVESSSNSGDIRLFKDLGHGKLRMGCSSSSCSFSKVRTSCQNKIDDEDDYGVPTLESDKLATETSLHRNRSATASSSQPRRHPEARGKFLEESSAIGLKCKRHQRDNEQTVKDTPKIKGPCEKSTSCLVSGRKTAEPVAMFRVLPNQENMAAAVNVWEKSELQRKMPTQGSHGCDKIDAFTSDPGGSDNPSDVRNGPQSVILQANVHRNHKMTSNWGDVNVPQSEKIGVLENDGADSGSSMVGSEVAVVISPDDAYRVMGPKNYWKTRQILRNQQRVFAEQVSELHRLIKVQKFLAASPSIFLEGKSCLPQPLEVSEKSLSSNSSHMLEWQQQNIPGKDDQQKEKVVEHKRAPISGSTSEVHHDKGQESQAVENGHGTGDMSETMSADSKHPASWCLPLPGNQWLITVMSPSEGLVYKPGMAPYPPNFGFMPSPFGGCSPMPMLPFPGGAFPIPMPSQQHDIGISTNYFTSSHGPPFKNQGTSPMIEQAKTFVDMPPREQVEEHFPSSGNSSNPQSDAFPCNNQKVLAFRDHESQGSVESAPRKWGKEALCDLTLGLPPDAVMERPQVIKAVPHNPRMATESAARIFRSIQKEKQLHD